MQKPAWRWGCLITSSYSTALMKKKKKKKEGPKVFAYLSTTTRLPQITGADNPRTANIRFHGFGRPWAPSDSPPCANASKQPTRPPLFSCRAPQTPKNPPYQPVYFLPSSSCPHFVTQNPSGWPLQWWDYHATFRPPSSRFCCTTFFSLSSSSPLLLLLSMVSVAPIRICCPCMSCSGETSCSLGLLPVEEQVSLLAVLFCDGCSHPLMEFSCMKSSSLQGVIPVLQCWKWGSNIRFRGISAITMTTSRSS